MKNNRETKNKKGMVPAILLVVMVLASTCAFAQSGGSKLLYKGMYTQSDQTYNGTTIPPFERNAFEVKIFEDKMEYWGWQTLKFKGLNNGKRIYENGNTTAYVDNNFNIFCVDEIPGFSHTEWRFIKGESTMPQGGNYGGGTGTYNSGNTGSGSNGNKSGTSGNPVQPHQITEDCPICHGSGKCNTCNGRGWIYAIGSSDHLDCPNCKPDGHCSHCGGSGKVTKTRYY